MRELVLIGAGHAHVQVLRMAAMEPLPARVTLVVDDPVAVYSGMIPGLVAGQYAPHELEIDARPLARRAGIRVIHAAAERIDPARKLVFVQGRPPIPYDVASLNIGSTVAGRDRPGVREHAVPTRPIRSLIQQLDRRMQAVSPSPRVVVVGAGAGGVELAFCVEHRLRTMGKRPAVTLLYRGAAPLETQHPRVQRRIVAAAMRRGIALQPHAEVVEVMEDGVRTRRGVFPSELTLWVTGAAAHGVAAASGLAVDHRGFVFVGDDLRVEGHPDLFAVGDCAVLRSWPAIPKAGVYAVREGPVLLHNIRARLEGRPLRAYRPQSDFFGILNLGDGTAVGMKWGRAVEGRWVMRHKDRIDRRFMRMFQVLDTAGRPYPDFAAPMEMDGEMVCGGCAAKVAQRPLNRALERLPPVRDAAVVVGLEEADDVVAWRQGDGLIVQNIDAFSAFTDDPWLVGRVAAHNATSDLWAKGVQPRFATAFVQIPENEDHEEVLFQVMAGLRASLDPDGITLLGGHTTLGEKLQVGLAVSASSTAIPWRNDGAQPGDGLVLTRPLGTGVLFHADMAGRAPGRAIDRVIRSMLRGNGAASRMARDLPVHAATDVTGFGLAGHLATLLRASNCGAKLDLAAIPLYEGVAALLRRGERSTYHHQNRTLMRSIAVYAPDTVRMEALFDPQTAGGLLFATPDPERLLRELHAGGEEGWLIGRCTAPLPSGALFEVR